MRVIFFTRQSSWQGSDVKRRPKRCLLLQKHRRFYAVETSKDGLFRLEAARCVGTCGLAPLVVIDGEVHANSRKKLQKCAAGVGRGGRPWPAPPPTLPLLPVPARFRTESLSEIKFPISNKEEP